MLYGWHSQFLGICCLYIMSSASLGLGGICWASLSGCLWGPVPIWWASNESRTSKSKWAKTDETGIADNEYCRTAEVRWWSRVVFGWSTSGEGVFDNHDYLNNQEHYDYDYEHDRLDDNRDVLIVQILPRLQYCNDQFHWSGPGLHVSEHKRYHLSFMIIITIDIWMMVLHFMIIIVL